MKNIFSVMCFFFLLRRKTVLSIIESYEVVGYTDDYNKAPLLLKETGLTNFFWKGQGTPNLPMHLLIPLEKYSANTLKKIRNWLAVTNVTQVTMSETKSLKNGSFVAVTDYLGKLSFVKAQSIISNNGNLTSVRLVATHKRPVITHIFYRIRFLGLNWYITIGGNYNWLILTSSKSSEKTQQWSLIPTKSEGVFTLKNRKFPNHTVCAGNMPTNWNNWNKYSKALRLSDKEANDCKSFKFYIMSESLPESTKEASIVSLTYNTSVFVSICPTCTYISNWSPLVLNDDYDEIAYFSFEALALTTTETPYNISYKVLSDIGKAQVDTLFDNDFEGYVTERREPILLNPQSIKKRIQLRYTNFDRDEYENFFNTKQNESLANIAKNFANNIESCNYTFKNAVIECSFSKTIYLFFNVTVAPIIYTSFFVDMKQYRYSLYEFTEDIIYQANSSRLIPCNKNWCEIFEQIPVDFLKEVLIDASLNEKFIQIDKSNLLIRRTGYLNVENDELVSIDQKNDLSIVCSQEV